MATTPEYVVGTPPPQTNRHPTIRTKPSTYYGAGRRDTGGGYERARSTEWRPHTARQSKEDVYASIHRLCAVAWLYPDDMGVGDVLDHLHGRDVHHKSGVEWDNREANLAVVGHGTHSQVTQAQMRAWAADSKRSAERDPQATAEPESVCAACGASESTLATAGTLDEAYCLGCVTDRVDGEPIEVL